MSMVEFRNTLPGDKGRSDTQTIQAAFPSTPALTGYDDSVVSIKVTSLHDGAVVGNPDFPNQSLDYVDAPTGADPNKVGKPGGEPWTDWAPNVASPGTSGMNANDIPPPPPGTPRDSHAGSIKLPGQTSPQIADQRKAARAPGNLIKGKSGATP